MNAGTPEAVSPKSVSSLNKHLEMLSEAYAKNGADEKLLYVLRNADPEEAASFFRRAIALAWSAGYLQARGER